MKILSYRGPGAGGGVAAAIAHTLGSSTGGYEWWHIFDSNLCRKIEGRLTNVASIAGETCNAHYRFCNNYLWPILHDMPQYVVREPGDFVEYSNFNSLVAAELLAQKCDRIFINDYQFALVPKFLNRGRRHPISFFWHIPWPSNFFDEDIISLAEISTGLLQSSILGFHTIEYALNFLDFVDVHLPDYAVDHENLLVTRVVGRDNSNNDCRIIVQPIGVDVPFWSAGNHADETPPSIGCSRVVLSVDRADYTKGILERLRAIDCFFRMNPSSVEQVSFLQVCQRTRSGLPAFDRYWNDCHQLAESVNARFAVNDWLPVQWIETPVEQQLLRDLYRRTDAMLISSIRDGLNLTAKEFVASSANGALLLSPNTGAWHELSQDAWTVAPQDPQKFSEVIKSALDASLHDRAKRVVRMRQQLEVNPLSKWWQSLTRDAFVISGDGAAPKLPRPNVIKYDRVRKSFRLLG